jgi:hypothetical protein
LWNPTIGEPVRLIDFSSARLTEVTTTRPALPIRLTASTVVWGSSTPTVITARSAIWPCVRWNNTSLASSTFEAVCVAPSRLAISSLNGFGSTATTVVAPA